MTGDIISEKKKMWQHWDHKCYEAMKKGNRDSMKKNKRSIAGQYSKFCAEIGTNEYPADEWQLARYACYTATHVTSIGTVKNYVGGVKSLQRLAGYEVPTSANSPNLKLVMNGLKAELARPTKQAAPLNRQILIEIAQQVGWGNQYHMCCYSATLLGFYLCLRCSNLIPTSSKKFNPQEQLTRGHVAIDSEFEIGMVDVEWSKTIQFKEKQLWLVMRPASREDICPLRTLDKFFKLVPVEEADPCFCFRNEKNELKALTYVQLSKQLKTWISNTGRDGSKYTLHGIRHGSTTHGYQAGLDGESLKLYGNWLSDAYRRYIDVELDKRVEAVVKFAEKM